MISDLFSTWEKVHPQLYRGGRVVNSISCFNLEEMRAVDIRTVDPSTLKDIRDVHIDPKLPFEKKAVDYLRQIGNAYCFRCGDVTVKVSHSKTDKSINDCMEGFFLTQ
jgi:hypothetical protein